MSDKETFVDKKNTFCKMLPAPRQAHILKKKNFLKKIDIPIIFSLATLVSYEMFVWAMLFWLTFRYTFGRFYNLIPYYDVDPHLLPNICQNIPEH